VVWKEAKQSTQVVDTRYVFSLSELTSEIQRQSNIHISILQYILEEDRNKQCGVGDTSKIIFDYYDDGKQIIDDSCGLRRGQAVSSSLLLSL